MTWAPIAHLGTALKGFRSTAEAVDWACNNPDGLKAIRYLREIVEMMLRLRTGDTRVRYVGHQDRLALSAFAVESSEDLFESLIRLNNVIAGFGLDDWMISSEAATVSGPSDRLSAPLKVSASVEQFGAALADAELIDGREVLETFVRLRCSDPRAEQLNLKPFTEELPSALITALREVNAPIGELGLDKRHDVTMFVFPPE